MLLLGYLFVNVSFAVYFTPSDLHHTEICHVFFSFNQFVLQQLNDQCGSMHIHSIISNEILNVTMFVYTCIRKIDANTWLQEKKPALCMSNKRVLRFIALFFSSAAQPKKRQTICFTCAKYTQHQTEILCKYLQWNIFIQLAIERVATVECNEIWNANKTKTTKFSNTVSVKRINEHLSRTKQGEQTKSICVEYGS